MRILFTLSFILITSGLFAQTKLMLVDVIRINREHKAEATYYFENNWKLFRDEAVKQGVITGYQFYETDNDGQLEFVLITEFKDEEQYANVEANFDPILKKLRPDGPVMLNEVKPAVFRETIATKKATVVAMRSSSQR
ncbi:MAG: hypothetical protein AB7O48_14995 [Cyclobacteriaceae bacterium]